MTPERKKWWDSLPTNERELRVALDANRRWCGRKIEGVQIMKITQEKLNEIIESHGKWLRNEQGGEKANLRGADLRDAYLGGAYLNKTYYQITRIGSRNATTTYCVEDDNVVCGCWNNYRGGTLEEFKKRVESVYGKDGKTPDKKYYTQYMAAIEFFEKMVKLAKMEDK